MVVVGHPKTVDNLLHDVRRDLQKYIDDKRKEGISFPEPKHETVPVFTASQAEQYVKDRFDAVKPDPTFEELVSRLDDSIRIRARRGKQQLQVFKTLRKDHDIYEAEVSDELVARLELHYEAAEYNWWPGEFDTTLSWAD